MPSSRSEFAELLSLLATDDRRLSGDLSPYLSRLAKNDLEFPFTFKQMIHTLYDAETWADKVKDTIEESKNQFKPLPEELKSPRLSTCKSSGEEGFQIRTIKKRCTGRTQIPDSVFVQKPTCVSHHARASTVDLYIECQKLDAAPSPTKRRPSQSRTTRPTLTINTGTRRPRHQSLTQLDAIFPLQGGLSPFSDSEDSEFDELATPTDIRPTSKLPLLTIPKRSGTIPIQPSALKGHQQTGRVRSSSFGGSTCLLVSPVFRTFEPDVVPMDK